MLDNEDFREHNIFGEFAADGRPFDAAKATEHFITASLALLGDDERAVFERGGGSASVHAHIAEKLAYPYNWTGLLLEMRDHLSHWLETHDAPAPDDELPLDVSKPETLALFVLVQAYAVRSHALGGIIRAMARGRR